MNTFKNHGFRLLAIILGSAIFFIGLVMKQGILGFVVAALVTKIIYYYLDKKYGKID